MRPPRSRLSRTMLGVSVVISAAVVLCSCASSSGGQAAHSSAPTGSQDQGSAVRGGDLVVRIAQDASTLDSVRSGQATTTEVSHMIFEQLLSWNADFEPTPVLAESYTVSKDKLTYTFNLRHGIVFSDGKPMTSKDVVASLKYWVNKNDYGSKLKPVIARITAKSKDTVVIKLKSPFNLLQMIAAGNGSEIREASAIASAPSTGIAKENIIGTGPYKLKKWIPGQKIVLERNEKYQPPKGESSGRAGAKHAYLDTITYKVIKDPQATLNALRTGQIDIAEPSNSQYAQIKANPDLKVSIEPAASVVYVGFNHNPSSFFSKPAARNALNLVIDKKAVMAAEGAPDLLNLSYGAFAARSFKPMYSEAGKAKWMKYNPEKAKALFKKAGYHGQTLRMVTTGEFPAFKDALVVIQDELREIGVKAKIQEFDAATLFDNLHNKPNSWDLLGLMGTGNPPFPSYCDNVSDVDVNAGYPRDKLQPLLDAYNAAPTKKAKRAALDDIQKFTSVHLPTIPLYDMHHYMAYTKDLHYDGWGFDFADAWLSE